MKRDRVLGGLLGLCIGDALGVPAEFISRSELKNNPITDMAGYGTHNQPLGTWSDDSALSFCLAESLCRGFDLQDIGSRMVKWMYEGYWTPYGRVFDVGITTEIAISRLRNEIDPLNAGLDDENNNGNGSLMRILPIAFYVEKLDTPQQFELTQQISRLTHGHLRAQMACGIYVQLVTRLLKGDRLHLAYKNMKEIVLRYYSKEPYSSEIHHFDRILRSDIAELPEESIKSGGYVVCTLEASMWAFLNSNSYADTVITAVNLGDDTDTTGSVAGGLAGVYYGLGGIPKEWISKIVKVEEIMELGERLFEAIYGI